MAEPVEALLFDVFGTLVDWRGSVARGLEAHFAPRGVVRDWDAVARAWRARYQPAMEEIRSGRRPFVVLDVLHAENIAAVAEGFGLGPLAPGEPETLARLWHRLDPWPEVPQALVRLKRRFVLAPVSNGNVRLVVDLARHAGLVFDTVLGAEVARAYKPMPEVYLRAAEMLALPPQRCLMVAAHNDDLRAAAALGFATAFLPRPDEWGPEAGRDLAPEGPWTFTARDLADLAGQLGAE